MNLLSMNPKLGILATIVTGAILIATFHSIAIAAPEQKIDRSQMNPEQFHERMHERMQVRLDKLAQRLEIKASQQAVWEDFAKSIETLAEGNAKMPGKDADAATIARFRAEQASNFAGKLNRIADATAKLQTVLTEDQRQILNQAAHQMLHRDHRFGRMHHDSDHPGINHGQYPHPAS
ncbi:MAG: Spy/CpxP family protein refolding chaperone [Gallionella sp.]